MWKPIKEFQDYSISNVGNVSSIYFKDKTRYLKPSIGKRGYYVVNLHKEGKQYTRYIHRLIAEAFIDNPNDEECIDHIDRNRLNNNISNLRYVNKQTNGINRVRGKTNELYVYFIGKSYKVHYKTYQKRFKTLEEAIKARDELLVNINTTTTNSVI